MTDKVFANGLIVKDRHPKTPDYVLCNLSIKVDEFIQTLKDNESNGWVNIKCLIARSGKPYAEVDTWQPTQGDSAKAGMEQARQAIEPTGKATGSNDFDDDIPF